MSTDPRALTATRLKGSLTRGNDVVDVTKEIHRYMHDWVLLTLAEMDEDDPRRTGYADLAVRLR